jgi:hypothetical protein
MRKTKISKAIDTLKKSLKKDESYRMSWQANIAMAFYDEFRRSKPKNLTQVHEAANKAASEFLTLLCR